MLAGAALVRAATVRAAGTKQGEDAALGPPEPFDFDGLRAKAKQLAAEPYRPASPPDADRVHAIDFEVAQQIHFRHERALRWPGGAFPVELFHLHRYAPLPVEMYVVRGGTARRVRYSPSFFDYGKSGLATRPKPDLGFSGFRVMTSPEQQDDWLAFQGASYFRSAGPLKQYGLSARGVAVDTTAPGHPEEFPRFVAFWLAEEPATSGITIDALLDGPSLSGAYRFVCTNQGGGVLMDVHAELFQRAAIAQLGIAPLTSMYWFSETNHRRGEDWRPEIHDSDGLAMWTGAGERIWRPLNNPPHAQTSSFVAEDPKGFGLLQRDREFDHYLDDGAYYDRRPSAWVEPKHAWGRGAVVLVELPTATEIEDNIVAFWRPDRAAAAASHWAFDYRLHWAGPEPFVPAVARVVATRLGRAGQPGPVDPAKRGERKLVIAFAGGPLTDMRQRFDLSAVVTASRGAVSNVHVLKILGTDRWRAEFDLQVTGTAPVDLRCYLRLDHTTLSETWLYQYLPGNDGPVPC